MSATDSKATSNTERLGKKGEAVQADAKTLSSEKQNAIPPASNLKTVLEDAKAKFYCEPCGKQYNSATEWDMHLSSYDHHHKKVRWREMNQMVTGRTKKQRMKKEQKQLTRDLDAYAEQFERATKERESREDSKPKISPQNVTPVQHNVTGMVFNLKKGKKGNGNGNAEASKPSKTCDAFGDDSDDN